MPAMFGTQKAQKKLMDDIITNFEAVGACGGQGKDGVWRRAVAWVLALQQECW